MLANDATGICEAIGKLFVGGEQKQPWSFRAVRANNDGLGFLALHGALFVKINGPRRAAIGIQFDPVHVGVWADFAPARLFRHSDGCREGAGLGTHFATKSKAEPAIDARAAPRTRLREDSHGRGKRMPAEFAGRAFENHAGGFCWQRRHWVRLGTWRVERTGISLSGNSNFPFDLCVVRLEVCVCYGPVGQSGAWSRTKSAHFGEVNFVEAPEICSEMYARATHKTSVDKSALRLGFLVRSLAERVGLKIRMIRQ